jgi:flagellar motility protein MotE (MotC chaperone)
MRLDRLLKLLAVAAAGVLATDIIEGGAGLAGSARSYAAVAPADPQAAPALAPPCARDAGEIAREAGISPGELAALEALKARGGELDRREAGISTEFALDQAAQAKVDARIAELKNLEGELKGLTSPAEGEKENELDRLAQVYQAMPPGPAAARLAALSNEVRLPIADRLRPRTLAAIVAVMPPADARRLTEALASRPDGLARAARDAPDVAPPEPTP